MTNQNNKDSPKYIARRQKVNSAKIKLSKDLRKSMTPAEKILWQHLRGNKLGGHHFRRQQIIDGFIVDFFCSKERLVIEVDGSVHENQKELDDAREHALIQRGLKVIRFSNREISEELESVVSKIEILCNSKT